MLLELCSQSDRIQGDVELRSDIWSSSPALSDSRQVGLVVVPIYRLIPPYPLRHIIHITAIEQWRNPPLHYPCSTPLGGDPLALESIPCRQERQFTAALQRRPDRIIPNVAAFDLALIHKNSNAHPVSADFDLSRLIPVSRRETQEQVVRPLAFIGQLGYPTHRICRQPQELRILIHRRKVTEREKRQPASPEGLAGTDRDRLPESWVGWNSVADLN